PQKEKVPKTTWKETVQCWKNGKNLPKIKSSVFGETSRAHSGGSCEFIQKTTAAARELPVTMKGDNSIFTKLNGKTTPVSFYNLDKSATLVSPPDSGKNFSHIATFHKHCSVQEREDLWRQVAVSVEKKLKKGEGVYVSTHGTGVPWLHVRIETTPKYYVSALKNT
ncbi:unnamed protein product, partial [Pylaiella littoralis]